MGRSYNSPKEIALLIVHCDWSISKFCASLIVLSGVRLIDYLVTYRQRHTFTKLYSIAREDKIAVAQSFSRAAACGEFERSWVGVRESQKPDAVALHCSARVPS